MEKHIHKYVRIKVGKNKRIEFKCALPGCGHILRDPEYVIGRQSICNRCGDVFIMERDLSYLARPHCRSCTKTKSEPLPEGLLEALEKL